VLQAFDPKLSEQAHGQLRNLKVDVRLKVSVQDVNESGVSTAGGFIHARTVIWAAGNAASPLMKSLPGTLDRAGRIQITPELNIPDHPEIYVIGDTALSVGKDGKPLPGVSPVAMQQGKWAAKNILARIKGDAAKPFSYWDRGSMATIGRNRAVADLHFVKFSGLPAWLTWVFVHLIFLMNMSSRISVFLIWVWSYFTRAQGARLITSVGKKS
jgi:NADH dehydrogenase